MNLQAPEAVACFSPKVIAAASHAASDGATFINSDYKKKDSAAEKLQLCLRRNEFKPCLPHKGSYSATLQCGGYPPAVEIDIEGLCSVSIIFYQQNFLPIGAFESHIV